MSSRLQSLKMQGREVEEMSAAGNALGDSPLNSVHQNEGTHTHTCTHIYTSTPVRRKHIYRNRSTQEQCRKVKQSHYGDTLLTWYKENALETK